MLSPHRVARIAARQQNWGALERYSHRMADFERRWREDPIAAHAEAVRQARQMADEAQHRGYETAQAIWTAVEARCRRLLSFLSEARVNEIMARARAQYFRRYERPK